MKEDSYKTKEDSGKSIILHIPHSSKEIPAKYRDQFILSDNELEREQLQLVDHHTEELYRDPEYGMVVFPVSRLLCDPERFEDDDKESKSSYGMGVIYGKTLSGKPLRRELSSQERSSLIKAYYRPHHLEITRLVEASLVKKDRALVVDCHSFPSRPFSYETDQYSLRPDICIGTDMFHTPKVLADLVEDYFIHLGYSVARNSPFSGSFVPGGYYQQNKRVESIMIEVNRCLYMDERTGEKGAMFEEVKTVIQGLQKMLQEYFEV